MNCEDADCVMRIETRVLGCGLDYGDVDCVVRMRTVL